MYEQGHHLLKRLGKSKLRPGGISGSNWLLKDLNINENTHILEVACNEADNLINFAQKYKNHNIGLDNNEEWLGKGEAKVANLSLGDNIKLVLGDARNLDFEDNSFDIILNEAMLTMISHKDKEKALKEYFRVLKPGGILLTHDIRQVDENIDQVKELQRVLNLTANPLTSDKWIELFERASFKIDAYQSDKMTLMSEEGMKTDEGEDGFEKIMKNALKDKNLEQFLDMKNFFSSKEVVDNLYYIVIKASK